MIPRAYLYEWQQFAPWQTNAQVEQDLVFSRPFNAGLFSETELEVLEKVSTTFKPTSTNDIIKLSHLEEAWKKNEKTKILISYEYAFELNQI